MPDTQISDALGLIDGGLQLLLAAVHADDPKREMLVRVGDLLRDVRSLEAALYGHVVVPRTISDSQLNKALGREEDARITPMFSMFRDFYHNIVAAPPAPEMEG